MSGMYYLFTQIFIWILIAFVLGFVCHWFFCCRRHNNDENESPATATQAAPVETKPAAPVTPQISDAWKPKLYATAPDSVDELKRIKGIGAVIEKTLKELGVYQFSQIAEWDENNCAWVDNRLSFPGRIAREEWVSQARMLDNGEVTEFAKRVDKGDVTYKT